MATLRNPVILLLVLYVCFLVFVVETVPGLPPLAATHFNAAGDADGWMPRASIVRFTLLLGFALPSFLVTIFWLIRFLPAAAINIPNKDYWLGPERREATHAMLLRHALWLACLSLAFVTGLHYLILSANTLNPPVISGRSIGGLSLSFMAGTVVWIVTLVRLFRR